MHDNHIPLYPLNKIDQKNNLQKETVRAHEIPKVRRRKIRSDKRRDIKFPVSRNEQIRLKTACKHADSYFKEIYGYDCKLTQTHFNTLLLQYGLKYLHLIDWNKPYQDTKTYMHTKPTESEYESIGGPYGLSTTKGLSDRKLVYLIVISVLVELERKGEYKNVLLCT